MSLLLDGMMAKCGYCEHIQPLQRQKRRDAIRGYTTIEKCRYCGGSSHQDLDNVVKENGVDHVSQSLLEARFKQLIQNASELSNNDPDVARQLLAPAAKALSEFMGGAA